nr:MAG TPA: hypothetical protein [Bacteriophage sp.]
MKNPCNIKDLSGSRCPENILNHLEPMWNFY